MRERLIEVAESLGAPRSMSRRDSGDLDEWFERAAGRPAFQLWGKAHDGQPWPMHPLLCHMLDVAAVAARMLAETTPHALRDRLLAIDPDREHAFRTLLFVIALHDFGKATSFLPYEVRANWALGPGGPPAPMGAQSPFWSRALR
jgi:hypothetical protein